MGKCKLPLQPSLPGEERKERGGKGRGGKRRGEEERRGKGRSQSKIHPVANPELRKEVSARAGKPEELCCLQKGLTGPAGRKEAVQKEARVQQRQAEAPAPTA